ncbi:hypothetical protein TeGR_g7447 [Tetraparma gracilis]|uniref:START domain-containing protein n=1 Tax=Tetraparma gracilis TaxID=2962635 RepID=A0ABQ6N6E2_9STRA|nr:hypothetical protein TeGR_g7447 [Tetraparma gracilis]
MSMVGEMRELFQRDEAIDGAKRSELADIIRAKNEIYADAENAVVDSVRNQLNSIPDSSFEKFESLDHIVEMRMFHKGGKNGTPRASTVLDEDICTCAAWTYQLMARHFVKAFYADGGTERAVTTHNDHSFTGQLLMDFNVPTFSPREFVTRYVWRWESETVLLVVSESCLAEKYPIRPSIVRGSVVTLEKFERLEPIGVIPQTRITWTQQPNMGGLIPSRAVRGAAVGQMMYLSSMRKRFDKSPAIDAASNLRVVTMIQNHDEPYTKKEEEILKKGRKMLEVFAEQKSKELKMASQTTQAKMAYKPGDKPAGDSSAKLCNMSEKEAKVIGGALASCIAANLTAPAAVDEWILRYPAMGELEREYVWYRPMMDTIAQRLLESVSWGLKMRLYTGAGLSTMDLLSDVFMIYTYATTEQQGTAQSLAIMVGLCLLGQLFLVWVQTHKGPRRVMLKEMLIVLSGMKPGIDAKRVADGNERNEHATVNPDIELTATRIFELICESIPGSVLQLTALVREASKADGEISKAALASIIVSACTTGFTAATISFDFDVGPQRRRDEPDFYGYIPDSAGRRTAIFFCMIMNGALLLLLRSVSTALLVVVDGR